MPLPQRNDAVDYSAMVELMRRGAQAFGLLPQAAYLTGRNLAEGIGRAAYRGVTLPGDVYAGRIDPNSDEAITRSMDLATTVPMAALPAAQSGTLGVFGGRMAANTLGEKGMTGPKAALDLAERMEAAGVSREQIYTATNKLLEETPYAGVSRGPDGKWRFEIDDSGLGIKGPSGFATVGDQYAHPELFSAYPAIATEGSRRVISPSVQHASGSYSPPFLPELPGFGITVKAPNAAEARLVAVHELQHAVQNTEGFSGGSNPLFGWNRYLNNPGEREARMVENRLKMTPEERRATPPWVTGDVTPGMKQASEPVTLTPTQNVMTGIATATGLLPTPAYGANTVTSETEPRLGEILTKALSRTRLTPEQSAAWRSGNLL